jgi:hypothetical protein
MYSVQGDVVVDPFLGTGTTTFAAIAAGRSSIGIEIDKALGQRIGEAILSCGNSVNEVITGRLQKHDEFVNKRILAGKPLKYVNEALGCRVMTGQETTLTLPLLDRIEEAGPGRFKVTCRKPVPPGGPEKTQP